MPFRQRSATHHLRTENSLTKQNVKDAVEQYKFDRDPKELLFQFKRCMVHFAVDDHEVHFCTRLGGNKSWFLPFNKGKDGGAGNPPNPDGIKTDYLWKEIFTRDALADIIENYAKVVVETDPQTRQAREKQIFPRYHQLVVVKALLADVKLHGVGQKYLIQHSAGSGKSNSIAWTAHQLVGLEKAGRKIFDSVVIITDRKNLDKQIKNTVKQFMQSQHIVGHAESSDDLRKLIAEGKSIIITLVHKFPHIVEAMGTEHRGRNFAIIIDEAHSSQAGNMAAKMNLVLSGEYADVEELTVEDIIILIMENRKLLDNASYFAFTATPKNKTLEMFGVPYLEEGQEKFKPFHTYTMKQAIEEGFILDVLQYYTPIQSYYHIAKTIEDDPLYDKNKAQKKLRSFVESNENAIAKKAEIIVDHFHEQIIVSGKINGKARAMVVTGSIGRAIKYYYAISGYLEQRKSQYKAIIAFSGEKEYQGKSLTESLVNGFSGNLIESEFKKDPYRFLVVADKFQTGFDEPLLHTMYVDKPLAGIKAVQTLSRLNRAHPGKRDVFILDFHNDPDIIKTSFDDYYTTTVLSEATEPDKLNDQIQEMSKHQVFTAQHVDSVVELFIKGAERDRLDPILDACRAHYEALSEDDQVNFKGNAKAFVRTYAFLGSILPVGKKEWERLSIFLNLLIPKLPSPVEEDLSKGILEAVDLESYRAKIGNTITLGYDEEREHLIDQPRQGVLGGMIAAELDYLSSILASFHQLWGNINWKDEDQVKKSLASITVKVSRDKAYQNAMKNSDMQNARIESERALNDAVVSMMTDDIEIFKQFSDNQSFRKWLADTVFNITYNTEGREYTGEFVIE
jgi:type I restriction enzyme, R subunit